MLVFPNAKINLGLNIVRKRKDGFHDISSCFYPVKWHDVLEIIESPKFEFKTSGRDIPGNPDQNLCIKAYKLLKKDYQLPNVSIHLHKHLPVGAGLGGGSSDATYTLKLLNELFQLFLDEDVLGLYTEQLGSDCSFFLGNKPTMVEGKGEILNPIELNLEGYSIMIIYPGVEIETGSAYQMITPSEPDREISEVLKKVPLQEWNGVLVNDFENAVFKKYPEIQSLKELLINEGALYASMSGSGSSVYGIFEKPIDPEQLKINRLSWTGPL